MANSVETGRRTRPALGKELLGILGPVGEGRAANSEEEERLLAESLLRDAARERASDIHLEPQRDDALLRFRIDGSIVDVARLDRETARRLVNQFKTLAGVNPVTLFAPAEGRCAHRVNGDEFDLRAVFAPCVVGEKMTVRLLDTRNLRHDIRSLGLSGAMLEQLEHWLTDVCGMFLVAGPTGSGKTTTVYALLQEMRHLERSIATLEDPVEYQIDGVSQLQVNEEHGLGFGEGIKAMLRMDPDFLLLGEIRDVQSARAAASAASSGHVLLSTLHSYDPVGAVGTLRNWGLEDYEIAASLQVVVSQRLVRTLCTACRREGPPEPHVRRWLEGQGADIPDATWHAVGCDECRGIGFRGRTGVFEVWRLTEEDLDEIAGHEPERTIRGRLQERTHQTLLSDGLEKARRGITSVRELIGSRLNQRGATDRQPPKPDDSAPPATRRKIEVRSG